jgi:putative oxidoreductase
MRATVRRSFLVFLEGLRCVEFFGGLLIALGVFTAIAALIASGEMAAAYFLRHVPNGLWPIRNHGEMAVLFCFVFLFIASRGDGTWSARRLLKR